MTQEGIVLVGGNIITGIGIDKSKVASIRVREERLGNGMDGFTVTGNTKFGDVFINAT